MWCRYLGLLHDCDTNKIKFRRAVVQLLFLLLPSSFPSSSYSARISSLLDVRVLSLSPPSLVLSSPHTRNIVFFNFPFFSLSKGYFLRGLPFHYKRRGSKTFSSISIENSSPFPVHCVPIAFPFPHPRAFLPTVFLCLCVILSTSLLFPHNLCLMYPPSSRLLFYHSSGPPIFVHFFFSPIYMVFSVSISLLLGVSTSP